MKKTMDFLYQIDSVVFENWYTQGLMLVLWTLAAIKGVALWWLGCGLLVYVALVCVNFYRRGSKEAQNLKALHSKHGLFPFVKGLNYCLLLGPLGIVLAVLLRLTAPKES